MKLFSLEGKFIKEETVSVSDGFTGIAEYENGNKEWFVYGKLHRLDGPALVYPNGSTEWYVNGKQHRLDGPACEYKDGTRYWCINGKSHKIDGPACEYSDGSKSWWIYGKKVTEEQCKLLYDIMKLKKLI